MENTIYIKKGLEILRADTCHFGRVGMPPLQTLMNLYCYFR